MSKETKSKIIHWTKFTLLTIFTPTYVIGCVIGVYDDKPWKMKVEEVKDGELP